MNPENPSNSTLRSHLEDLVDVAQWGWLSDLAKQGKVLLLAPSLEIVEVGLALAEDDISKVHHWLADGWLYRPSEAQILAWDLQMADNLDQVNQVNQVKEELKDLESLSTNLITAPIFRSLIIQPFVLAKETVNYST